MLSELQKDVLTELVNVYIGQAASLLSEMVHQKVELSIPLVELLTISESNDSSQRFLDAFSSGHVVSSSMNFGHEFQGKAFLMFPADQAKLLVNACLLENIAENIAKDSNQDFGLLDTDFDVLREIGNIIINAVIGNFANLMGIQLEYSVPDIDLIFIPETKKYLSIENEIYILILHTSFIMAETRVKGALLIALSMNSVSLLITKINNLLEEL